MLNKQFWLSLVAAFLTLSVYGFVVWGLLLPASFFAAMGGDWRPEGEELMAWIVIADVVKAFALVWIFGFGFEDKGIAEGLRFGFFTGLLFASPQLIMYAVRPESLSIAAGAFAIDLVSFLLAGAVLAIVYRATGGRSAA